LFKNLGVTGTVPKAGHVGVPLIGLTIRSYVPCLARSLSESLFGVKKRCRDY